MFAMLLASTVAAGAMHPSWQAPGTPAVASQPVVFESDGAVLHGTLYRPVLSQRAPAVVVFHSAGVGRSDAALYTHLREVCRRSASPSSSSIAEARRRRPEIRTSATSSLPTTESPALARSRNSPRSIRQGLDTGGLAKEVGSPSLRPSAIREPPLRLRFQRRS